MSTDPALALQGAITARLKAAATEAGTRIYDTVPRDNNGNITAPFPYISLGEAIVTYNGADCYDGSDTALDVHVWSRAVGFPECKRIADAVRTDLNNAEFALDGHTLESLEIERTQYLRDPDGITRHAVLSFRALTQPKD